MIGKAIRVRGTVQGVGFRPYIWHLAQHYALKGSVWNDEQGVMIHAWGEPIQLRQFIEHITRHPPPLAKVVSLDETVLNAPPEQDDFQILASQQRQDAQTAIAADAATCPACLADIQDPNNRRYRYPFTNCTHCGPRLSIIQAVPYDRCHTSMAQFPMCRVCQAEYDDPGNRRFHAQANCCPDCGPTVWLEDCLGQNLSVIDAIQHATDLLAQGYIIAIKGLGGFHLACDATNETAVAKLRQRKGRYAKPFALMAKNIELIKDYALVGPLEQQALTRNSAAIVILAANGKKLAASVAINDDKLGFMLPYSPLHTLLLQPLDYPLVMTSGNVSEQPQCVDNQQARQQLHGIADYFLMHNRDIVNRLDDSVIRKLGDHMHVLRRARGFSPEVLNLPEDFNGVPQILAMGAELKNTFCILKEGTALVSQHIGDLEDAQTQRDYRRQLELYQQLFDFKADVIAVDCHPDYLSTQYGQQLANAQKLPIQSVQHHHAHIAACMIEHALPLSSSPVLAAVFDGLGMGPEGALWGGEFLLGDYVNCTRLGHFQAIALPGGVQAIREPWRNAFAQLAFYFDYEQIRHDYADLAFFALLADKPLAMLTTMMAKKLNSPLSSSCGRWFDALAALLCIAPEQVAYEGQAAILLEAWAATEFNNESGNIYGYTLDKQPGRIVLSWKALWQAVLNDLQRQTDKAVIAARIHHTLAAASVELLIALSIETQTDTIVLSGGVFQNELLLAAITQQLQQQGKTVLSPYHYPMNDGGIALGQAVIAGAKRLSQNKTHE